MSTWPSVLSTLTDPNAGDRLNSPSHSSIEAAQNDALEKLETFIGTSSSAVGTLMYNIRATASDGGGHVQVANKGGTGQTSYTKGDILVATSSSVLAKLTVGGAGQSLVVNSGAAAGVQWDSVAGVPASVTTMIPKSPLALQYGQTRISNPSIANIGLVSVPSPITASTVTIRVDEATASGTGDFTLYRESGASSIFTVTLPDMGANQTNYSASISPTVAIPQGNYYAAFNTNGASTNLLVATWMITRGNPSVLALGGISGRGVYEGTIGIAAGAPPASITTTALTSIAGGGSTVIFRLDG